VRRAGAREKGRQVPPVLSVPIFLAVRHAGKSEIRSRRARRGAGCLPARKLLDEKLSSRAFSHPPAVVPAEPSIGRELAENAPGNRRRITSGEGDQREEGRRERVARPLDQRHVKNRARSGNKSNKDYLIFRRRAFLRNRVTARARERERERTYRTANPTLRRSPRGIYGSRNGRLIIYGSRGSSAAAAIAISPCSPSSLRGLRACLCAVSRAALACGIAITRGKRWIIRRPHA